MHKLTLFFGGSVGADPYAPGSWSGIPRFLLDALQSNGLLDGFVGVRVPSFHDAMLKAKNFNRNRSVWRTHYYFDAAYRRALTEAASQCRVSNSWLMQVGHMFCLPTVFPGKNCISYHDGNLSERLKSGFGFEGISRKRIDQALRFEEETAGQMTAIFTFSDYLRQSFIADYRVPAERVFSVGGGINFTEFPSVNPEKKYAGQKLLFIGIEFARKGGPQLLKAFQAVRSTFPKAELHIVGPSKLEGLPPGVVFHGRLSKSDPEQNRKLVSLFENANLFVLPSLYEPFGIAPLEAMLYQIPCIVTDGWALRETVTPGVNGDLVAKGSVDELASKIIKLLSDPDRLAVMGRQGRERALRCYTWESVAKRMALALSAL